MKKSIAAAIAGAGLLLGFASVPAQAGVVAVCVSSVPIRADARSDLEPRISSFTDQEVEEILAGTDETVGGLSRQMVEAACASAVEGLRDAGTTRWFSLDHGRSGYYEILATVYADDLGNNYIKFGVGFGDTADDAYAAAIANLVERANLSSAPGPDEVAQFEAGSF